MTFAEALQRNRLLLFGALLLLAALYWRIVPGMVSQWYSDENYSHGFFVPLIAAWFLYERRAELLQEEVAPWNPGLLILLLGLLQLLFGFLAIEYFTMRSSLLVVLAGLLLFLFGRRIFRLALFPLAYLVFMVPLPYIIYDSFAFPLKLFVTRISVAFLKLIGVVVLREGNLILFPATTLEVSDACSGMRSIVSLLALSAAYALYLHTSGWRRWLLIFAALPIAVCTNALRIIVTGILAEKWGAKAAEGFFHEGAGLVVFGLSVGMLLLVGKLVKREG
jgi:exosortase